MISPREGVPTAELMAAFANQPRLDYNALRSEMDEFFGDDYLGLESVLEIIAIRPADGA